ncbi:MAG TPA: RsmG family class I SAM-dependent methyltransferase [Acidimicrobiales bacterium]|nr:RsmG family class I SAM-dependent methyltransferase [Acidimicrobiales bacterium]
MSEARRLGFLGPGPVEAHVVHALGFGATGEAPATLVDLGSGGGVPGLVLLALWSSSAGVLLDSSERRTAFLRSAVRALGWQDRVEVLCARAEEAGRDPVRRGKAGLVVSRGFGPPAVAAECAAPLLVVGGRLVVSEPPEDAPRWPAEPLAGLGLRAEGAVLAHGSRFQVLRQVAPCPDAYPRRVGLPAKRPLW